MSSGVYSALSGALAKMRQIEISMNNLANVDNVGFKGDRISFESMFKEKLQNGDAKGINFTRTSVCYTDFSQGDVVRTGQPLDLAIKGRGFFKVVGDDGFLYTRQGNFKLDPQGNLVTSDTGLQVVGEEGPLNFPFGDVSIDQDGTVAADGGQIAKLTVYEVTDDQSMTRKGNGLWEAKKGEEDQPSPDSTLLQGSLEHSNVNPVLLTTDIIEIKRAYAAFMNTMKAFGEISEKAREIGRIG